VGIEYILMGKPLKSKLYNLFQDRQVKVKEVKKMQAQVVLTPHESKRLIAKGVAQMSEVKKALASGMLAVSKGSTNGYVAEEILNKKIEKRKYITGIQTPAKSDKEWLPSDRLGDYVFQNGQLLSGVSAIDSIKLMRRGDVFIKGANALNYSEKAAAIELGSDIGGTIGSVWGTISARGVHLVIPVGLEKLVAHDLLTVSSRVCTADSYCGPNVGLMVVTGHIFTEIEALKILVDVDVWHMGSGGVGGAEGAVHLVLSGEEDNINKAVELVSSIQGEVPFHES
jgi:hypothetical protein